MIAHFLALDIQEESASKKHDGDSLNFDSIFPPFSPKLKAMKEQNEYSTFFKTYLIAHPVTL